MSSNNNHLKEDSLRNPLPTDEDYDEEDEEDDEDYNPDNEQSAGSEIDEDDEIEEDNDTKKMSKKKGTTPSEDKAVSESTEQTNKLVQIDEDKVDSFWDDILNKKNNNSETTKKKEILKEETKLVTKRYDFAGETVVVQEEVKVLNKVIETKKEEKIINEPTDNDSSTIQNKRPLPMKRTGDLSSLISQLKKPKMSTLSKSLHDWNDFKKKEDLDEQLKTERRGKNSFLERQAFLDRTDLREFEREKSIRDHERRMRQNNKPN